MKSKSKLLLVLGVFALSLSGPPVFAHGDHSAGGNTPAARADKLEEALGLNEEQAKKIEVIYTDEVAALKVIRDKKLEAKAQREEFKVVRAASLEKIKAVLTAEQSAKLDAQNAERAKAREAAEAAK